MLYLNGGHPTWGALDYVKLFAFTLCSFSPHRAIAAVCRYTCFLCHITFESLPQEAKLNVDQCLAPFAESRTKLTGETLRWTESLFHQFIVAGLLFLTKAAGVFEGLRAPCLVNSADVAKYSSSRRLPMPRCWCFFTNWHPDRLGKSELLAQWYYE